jgi:hypothetical protein
MATMGRLDIPSRGLIVIDEKRRQHRQILLWTIIGVSVAVVAVAVSVWAEYRPDDPPRNIATTGGTAGTTPTPDRTTSNRPGGGSPSTEPFRFLSTLQPSSRTHLADLPRDLPGPSTYDRAIAIRCPGKGRTADVSFDLFGGYAGLTATVRAVFAVDTDIAIVTALAVTKNPDDTVNKRPAGQVAVQAGATASITGDLDAAQQLVLQVRCPSAEGVVVIDDGRLTRAA